MSLLLTPTNYKIYKTIVKKETPTIGKYLYDILNKYYTNVITNDAYDYILAEGDIPIALIAHMDTVFEEAPKNIYYDPIQEVVWSPQGGVGDDRAGIFLILSLMFEGYRPTIIFTNDEEYGGLGANELIKDYPLPPWKLNFCIELDRHGVKDAIFYNCHNDDFEKYITNFNFEKQQGLFTDICIICPAWKIAGVNLSIGYIYEHSQLEHWYVEIAYDTYKKVIRILENNNDITYSYIPGPLRQCDICHKLVEEDDLFPAILKDGENGYICTSCMINKDADWCEKCGKIFIGSGNLCRRCNNGIKYDFSQFEI